MTDFVCIPFHIVIFSFQVHEISLTVFSTRKEVSSFTKTEITTKSFKAFRINSCFPLLQLMYLSMILWFQLYSQKKFFFLILIIFRHGNILELNYAPPVKIIPVYPVLFIKCANRIPIPIQHRHNKNTDMIKLFATEDQIKQSRKRHPSERIITT